MDIIFLVIISILPPIAFLLYMLHMDKLEPEPTRLIIKVLIYGGLSVIPAALIEIGMEYILIFAASGITGAAIKSFIIISPVEEAVKLAVVFLFIWKNSNFNEENDGIVYVGTAAIGFAMFENILYVVQTGLATGIMRAVTSIPLHTFTGVLMGYFVGIAKFAPEPRQKKGNIITGFFIAYIIHGVYDTFVLSGTEAAFLVIPLVIALFILGYIYLKKGKELSAKRWGALPLTVVDVAQPTETAIDMSEQRTIPAQPPSQGAAVPSGTGTYKVVISRILFVSSALFWMLLIIGITEEVKKGSAETNEIIAGGILLTMVPIVIGIVLEVSHARHKKQL